MLRKSPRLPTSAPPYIVPGSLGGPTNTTPELPKRRKTIRSARLGPRSSGRRHFLRRRLRGPHSAEGRRSGKERSPGIGDGTHHNQNIDDAGHGHCHPSLTLSDELIVFSCSSRKSGAEETDGLRRNATSAEGGGHVRAVMED